MRDFLLILPKNHAKSLALDRATGLKQKEGKEEQVASGISQRTEKQGVLWIQFDNVRGAHYCTLAVIKKGFLKKI